ncbi:MAG: hypothetical protein FWF78_09085 [Defluviitaleaceae bacterium]|nr:hypothetical protein [Defluviitaleaceae bacterium]
MRYVVTILLVCITLLQGGFTDAVWALVGIALVLFLLFKAKKMPDTPVVVLMLLLVAIYAISVVFSGLSFEALAGFSRILVVVLLIFVFYNVDADITQSVFVAGMVVASIGVLSLFGVINWEGAVVFNRLQSVFQYANAAGFFLGISAFLARLDSRYCRFAPFLEIALVLTQSVGALVVYGLGWMFYKGWRWWYGAVAGFAIVVVFFVRGLHPIATFLERLIHIWDGFGIVMRYPFGLGVGAWQFELFAYQSSLYSVARIHNEYVAMGVDAGFLAFVLVFVAIFYWVKNKQWSGYAICVIMVLVAAFVDIPFMFLSIVIVFMWLVTLTLPKTLDIPKQSRFLFLLPLVLFAIVFAQSAIKNHAAWIALTDPLESTQILSHLPISNDADASLTRLSIYLAMEKHDLFDQVFDAIPNPSTVAHAQRTRSLIQRGLYYEAASSAIITIQSGPFRQVTAEGLLEQILPNLDYDFAKEIQQKAENSIPIPNPLLRFIQAINGE